MLTSALLPMVLASAFADPPVLARPYGNVMGDGLGLGADADPPAGAVCAPGETLFGIDVSYYQDTIDWNAVAADGVQFAIVRVSHSLQFFDPQFEANLAGARAAGIHTGVYQYFEPDEDPVAQADLLIEALGPLQPGDLPPMIDVESTAGLGPAAINDAIHAWIDRVEGEYGVKPVIYSGYYFWNDNVGSTDFGDYPLMLPWYGVDCPGGVPNGWDMWTIHQYCDCGSVSGVSGNVDVNRFNGTLADLEALTFAPVCGDATCSGSETPYTCAEDCPPCGTIEAAGGTLDNGNACYSLYGDAQYWREEAVGEGGSSVWTYATAEAMAYNYAIWQLHFAEAGEYDLEVHIAQPFGKTTNATYVVRHAGGETPVVIDQSANDGWVSLGEFQFDAAADHTVLMGDNTGESADANVQIVFDAVRVTRIDLDPGTTSGAATATDPTTDPSGGSESDGDPTDGDPGDGTSDGDAGDTDDTAGALPPPSGESTGGCGCSTDVGGRGLALLPMFALAFVRRRRDA